MADRSLVLQDTADGDKVLIKLKDNGDGTYRFDVNATLETGDIEIGQVELKDGDSSAVANIKAANTARTTATIVLATQNVDAAGNVIGIDAANTARTAATKVLPVQNVDAAGNVLGRTAANTARTTATLVDPTQLVDAAGNVINVTAANTARSTSTLVLPIQQVDAAGNIFQQVGGTKVSVSVEMTRTTDTTTYAANDVVSDSITTTTVQTVANFARVNAGTGYIVGCKITTDKKSITPSLRVHVFNAVNPTVAADNAQWKELYADLSKRIVYFDLPPMSTAADAANSDMSRSFDMNLRVPFVCAGGTRSVFFVIETLTAFIPASAEKFTLTLFGELD